MRFKAGSAALLALGVLALPASAGAAGTLDQHQDAVSSQCGPESVGVDSAVSVAQTFRAGLTGNLDQVSLDDSMTLNNTPLPLNVEIRPLTANGLPHGLLVLGSGSQTAASVANAF